MVAKRKDYSSFISGLTGYKTLKIAVDAGFTCPNRDWVKGIGGCIYCNNAAFTPSYCNKSLSISEQLELGKSFYEYKKYNNVKYLAYFQAFSGTYAPIHKLKEFYEEALSVQDVCGLVIATRPDCIDTQTLAYLSELNKRTTLIVELGIESVHDKTLKLINRCHKHADSIDAINALSQKSIRIGAHLILGLPNENITDIYTTIREVSNMPISSLKFHQMQVIKGTRLEQMFKDNAVNLIRWTADEYADVCAEILRRLPERIVVERFVSQSPRHITIFPAWDLKPGEFKKILDYKINQKASNS